MRDNYRIQSKLRRRTSRTAAAKLSCHTWNVVHQKLRHDRDEILVVTHSIFLVCLFSGDSAIVQPTGTSDHHQHLPLAAILRWVSINCTVTESSFHT